MAWIRRRYQLLYVYAFVRPTTGQSWWCLLPTVRIDAMNAALAAFAHDEGLDPQHRAVLVLDGTPRRSSSCQTASIWCSCLRPPELQPVERVYRFLDEPVANRTFADLDSLENVLVTQCQTLRADLHRITAHTRFHWWARERRPVHQ